MGVGAFTLLLLLAAPVLAKQGSPPPGHAAAPPQAQGPLRSEQAAARKTAPAPANRRGATRAARVRGSAGARATTRPRSAASGGGLGAPRPVASARARASASRPVASKRARDSGRASAPRKRGSARRAARAPLASTAPAAASPASTTPTASAQRRPGATRRASVPRTSAPRSEARDSGGLAVVTRTVSDIVEVIPAWAKALIAALAALLAVAAALIALSALRARRLGRQRAALVEQVGVLQAALLPQVPATVGSLSVSVAYRPAAGLAAGGDFYDVFPLDGGRVGLVVGDVSGHGRESLGPATFIRHMVRSYLEAGLIPRAALQLAGKVVDEHKSDEFATVAAAVYDPLAGTLAYATAGHPPPIVIGPGEHEVLTVASSPPIGVGSPTGVRQTTLPIAHGSTVCFFTDGLIEARRGSAIFGRPSLEEVLGELGPDASAEDVIASVAGRTDAIPDDVAVCLVRPRTGAVARTSVRVEDIEITLPELHSPRLRRFLEAGGLAPAECDAVITSAAAHVVKQGSVVLRMRIAGGRTAVDLLDATGAESRAALTLVRQA